MGRIATMTLVLAAFVVGAISGAWLVYRNTMQEVEETPGLLAKGVLTELERRAAAAAPSSTAALPQPAPGAATPLDRPPAAAPSPVAAAVGRLMPEPPASWMTVEQQRAAADEYREWVREEGRLAGERARGLNAELFMIEGQDPTWGAAIESKVRAALVTDAVFAGIELEGIECRVTVCRAVLRFPEADSPQGLPNGGRSIWSAWRGAQIIPNRAEINDGVPGFRVTVFLGDDFDRSQVTPRDPRNRGPGGP